MKWLTKTNIFYILGVTVVGCALSFLAPAMPQFEVLATSDNETVTYLTQNKTNLITMIMAIFGIVIVMITEELTRTKHRFVSFVGAVMVKVFGAVILSVMAGYYYSTDIPLYMYFIFWLLVVWLVVYGIGYLIKKGEDVNFVLIAFIGSVVLVTVLSVLFYNCPVTASGNIYVQLTIGLSVLVYLGIKGQSFLNFSRKKTWSAFQIILTCICFFFISSSFVSSSYHEKEVHYPYTIFLYETYEKVIIKADSLGYYIENSSIHNFNKSDVYSDNNQIISYALHPNQSSDLVLESKLLLIQTTRVIDSLRVNEDLSFEEKKYFLNQRFKETCKGCTLVNIDGTVINKNN